MVMMVMMVMVVYDDGGDDCKFRWPHPTKPTTQPFTPSGFDQRHWSSVYIHFGNNTNPLQYFSSHVEVVTPITDQQTLKMKLGKISTGRLDLELEQINRTTLDPNKKNEDIFWMLGTIISRSANSWNIFDKLTKLFCTFA